MKAMIFAAGLGTRLRPLTNDRPKALVEVNGITLLERRIRHLIDHGFTDIIVNVHHFADTIIEFLAAKNNFGIQIQISNEEGELLETGGGLKKAQPFFDDQPFLVCNADIITDLNLTEFYRFHLAQNALATLATRTRKTSRYLMFDEIKSLFGWINDKTKAVKIMKSYSGQANFYAFSGLQILSPRIFEYLGGFDGKFSTIDVYLAACKQEKIMAYPHDESVWIDVGNLESLAKANETVK